MDEPLDSALTRIEELRKENAELKQLVKQLMDGPQAHFDENGLLRVDLNLKTLPKAEPTPPLGEPEDD